MLGKASHVSSDPQGLSGPPRHSAFNEHKQKQLWDALERVSVGGWIPLKHWLGCASPDRGEEEKEGFPQWCHGEVQLGSRGDKNTAAALWVECLLPCKLSPNEACGKLAFLSCVYVFVMALERSRSRVSCSVYALESLVCVFFGAVHETGLRRF